MVVGHDDGGEQSPAALRARLVIEPFLEERTELRGEVVQLVVAQPEGYLSVADPICCEVDCVGLEVGGVVGQVLALRATALSTTRQVRSTVPRTWRSATMSSMPPFSSALMWRYSVACATSPNTSFSPLAVMGCFTRACTIRRRTGCKRRSRLRSVSAFAQNAHETIRSAALIELDIDRRIRPVITPTDTEQVLDAVKQQMTGS
jgi:hypothetical protein